MKRLATKLFAALGLLVLAATPAFAISLEVDPTFQTRFVGDSVFVDLRVTGLDAAGEIVSAFDLDVLYNTTILGFVGATFTGNLGGPADSVQFAGDLGGGAIDVFESSFLSDSDLAALQGDVVLLATLQFSALAVGTSPVDFDSDLLFGRLVVGLNATDLAPTVAAGSVQVIAGTGDPQVPLPGSLALLGVGAAVMVALRHRLGRA